MRVQPLQLVIAFLFGFIPVLVSPVSQAMNDMEGALSLADLLNIEVISATKTARKINDAPSIINVYTAAYIDTMGFRTLADLLWTIAGVQVEQTPNRRPKVWFRGALSFFNNKTALFVDGVPYRDGFGAYDIDWAIPLKNIARVEVIRGPGSSLYGANAFSGMINIFTKQPGENANEGQVEIAVGNFDTRVVNVAVDKTADFGSLLMEASFFDTQGQVPRRDRNGVLNTVGATQSTKNLSLKGAFLEERLMLNITQHEFSHLNVGKGMNRPTPLEYKRASYDIKYRQDIPQQGAELFFNIYRIEQSRLERDRKLSSAKEEVYFDKTNITDANAMLTYPLFDDNELVAGVEWQREKNNGTPSSVIDYDPNNTVGEKRTETTGFLATDPKYIGAVVDNFAVYVQDTHTFQEGRTTAIVGLRLDALDLFGNQLSYRAGLVNQLTDKIFAKALYGTAFRAPIFLEYSRSHKKGDVPGVADVSLPKVEEITTLEFQLGYHDHGHLHSITVFQNDYADYISEIRNADDVEGWWGAEDSVTGKWVGNPDAYWFEDYGNTGNLVMRGVELESQVILFTNMNIFANFAYLKTKDKRTEKALPLLTDLTGVIGISWRSQYGPGEWLVSSYVTAYAKRKDWEAVQVSQNRVKNYGNLRKDSFSGRFAIWNAKLGYQLEQGDWSGLDFSLEVKNILNVNYYSQGLVTYNKRFDSNSELKTFKPFFDTPYDDRTLLVSLAYHW